MSSGTALVNDLFAEACDALWGAHWRVAAAEAFGVSTRLIGRWAAGSAAIPPEVWPELAKQIADHRRALAEIGARLPLGRS